MNIGLVSSPKQITPHQIDEVRRYLIKMKPLKLYGHKRFGGRDFSYISQEYCKNSEFVELENQDPFAFFKDICEKSQIVLICTPSRKHVGQFSCLIKMFKNQTKPFIVINPDKEK